VINRLDPRNYLQPVACVQHRWLAFWGFVLCGAVAVGCARSSAQATPPAFGSGLKAAPATGDARTLEHRMSELVNRDRKRNHLPPLAYDEKLADAARSHSADMHANHFFAHESPTYGQLEQRLTRAGYLFLTSRENLAEAVTVEEAEEGLLRSPHHYENLMAKDIKSIGIGIIHGGPKDARNLVVTQIFATPGKLETDQVAGQRVAQSIREARAKASLPELMRLAKLDAMAERHLDAMTADLDEGSLRPVAKAVAEELVQLKQPALRRVSVGGQVVLDSSQFQADGVLMHSAAKGFGLAVKHGKDQRGAPRLKILFLVALD
jgi:uncharacterized protein YkwD